MAIVILFPTLAEIPGKIRCQRMKSQNLYPMHGKFPCYVAYTGTGKNMAKSIEEIMSKIQPSLFLSIGYAGGLSNTLQAGDIVLCRQFLSEEKKRLEATSHVKNAIASCLLQNGMPFQEGSSFTSSSVICNRAEKEMLFSQGAMVVEMENYWAAEKAILHKIPFLGIRIVLDSIDFSLPDLSNTIREDGQISFWNTLVHILQHPVDLFSMRKIYSLTKRIEPVLLKCCQSFSSINNKEIL